MRTFVRRTLAVLLLGLVALPLAAQDIQPAAGASARDGFWWGLGLGVASATGDCDGCPGSLETGTFPMLDLHLGTALSPKFALGLQLTGGMASDAIFASPDADETIGDLNVSAYFFPMTDGNLWLQGGIGALVYKVESAGSEFNFTGAALTLGAGYDIPVGKMFITPSLRFVGTGEGDIKDEDDNVQSDSWKNSFVHFGVAINWR
jgi:hypothetical protein